MEARLGGSKVPRDKNLPERMRRVVHVYFEQNRGREHKGIQAKIAKYFGVSRQRVYQLFKEEREQYLKKAA